jgi:outer membrane protein OmpA-like peptidoglycan-associated protein
MIAKGALAAAPCVALGLLAAPSSARAVDVSLKLEPGVAIPLTAPQSQIYNPGVGQSVKALFGLTPYLDLGPSTTFLLLPAATKGAESGVAWGFGAGLRLKRPHDAESFHGISPWLDVDAFYVRTGDLNRPGLDAAVGLSVPIGESRTFWVGPFVRYLQVIQPGRAGFDNSDAKTLTVGISFEVGSGIDRKPEVVAAAPAQCPAAAACPAPAPAEVRMVTKEVCSDTDGDGIPDNVDHCPNVSGPMDNWGCPVYQKLVVKRDKLELKEKLYFAWDQAKLEPASYPVLDEVVLALKDNKEFRVQIEGHTDSSGGETHNQTLSKERAEAVLQYLAAHGIASDRLISKGFSSANPTDTNTTAAGRENNRRVDFVVHFIIVKDGGAK